MADADRKVDAVLDQIDDPVFQPQLTGHFGIALQIGRHQRADMQPAEADGCRDHEPPARPGAFAFGRAFGLLDIGEDAPGPFQVARAGVGQGHRPRGPLQQPRTETLFQRRDQPRHRRRRQLKLARRRREPLQVGDRDKGLHGVDPVHAIISYIAIVKCQLAQLFKFRRNPS